MVWGRAETRRWWWRLDWGRIGHVSTRPLTSHDASRLSWLEWPAIVNQRERHNARWPIVVPCPNAQSECAATILAHGTIDNVVML